MPIKILDSDDPTPGELLEPHPDHAYHPMETLFVGYSGKLRRRLTVHGPEAQDVCARLEWDSEVDTYNEAVAGVPMLLEGRVKAVQPTAVSMAGQQLTIHYLTSINIDSADQRDVVDYCRAGWESLCIRRGWCLRVWTVDADRKLTHLER